MPWCDRRYMGLAPRRTRYIVLDVPGRSPAPSPSQGRLGRENCQMDGDFRRDFVREPAGLKQNPALVLNADYRPLSYYPLSLWPWQESVKAVWLDRVDIVAEYDHVVRSPSMRIRMPSVVVLRDY